MTASYYRSRDVKTSLPPAFFPPRRGLWLRLGASPLAAAARCKLKPTPCAAGGTALATASGGPNGISSGAAPRGSSRYSTDGSGGERRPPSWEGVPTAVRCGERGAWEGGALGHRCGEGGWCGDLEPSQLTAGRCTCGEG